MGISQGGGLSVTVHQGILALLGSWGHRTSVCDVTNLPFRGPFFWTVVSIVLPQYPDFFHDAEIGVVRKLIDFGTTDDQ